MKTDKEIIAEYDEIFGEKHHKICEGKKCECHKEVKDFILNALKEQREELVREISGIIISLEHAQEYCVKQNGIHYCKNCGLNFDKILNLLK